MAHTPGPWREGEWGGAVVADHPVEGMEMPFFHDIEETRKVYGGYLIAESIAPCNKPLIMAAPDLLKACKAALAWHENWDHQNCIGFGEDERDEVIRKLGTAIAKAEGGGEK